MKKIFLLLVFLFVYGCAGTGLQNTALRHETDESSLLTEAEFMARVSQSATRIYEGLYSISAAAKLYALDNDDSLPSGNPKVIRSLLLDGGYLEVWPVIPPFAFTDPVQYDYRYSCEYDNMDGIGASDDVIYAQDLKIEVCEKFVRAYSSANFGDMIYDFEAAGKRYPGETIGRHIKIYAINWSMVYSPDYCDIEWIMQYNVPLRPSPGNR